MKQKRMPGLFPDAYIGRVLAVSAETDAILRELFPEVDISGEYREADGWLLTHNRKTWPRNRRRFLVNWMKKSKRRIERQDKRDRELRAAINAGRGPEVKR